jgi:hypothetical protein
VPATAAPAPSALLLLLLLLLRHPPVAVFLRGIDPKANK